MTSWSGSIKKQLTCFFHIAFEKNQVRRKRLGNELISLHHAMQLICQIAHVRIYKIGLSCIVQITSWYETYSGEYSSIKIRNYVTIFWSFFSAFFKIDHDFHATEIFPQILIMEFWYMFIHLHSMQETSLLDACFTTSFF